MLTRTIKWSWHKAWALDIGAKDMTAELPAEIVQAA